jgi:hypothetical protein
MSENRQDLIAWVERTCVRVRLGSNTQQAKDWCLENVGDLRQWHPLREAQEGRLDYFDGNWAITIDDKNEFITTVAIIDPIYNFWFEKERDAAAFALRWGRV